MNLTDVGKAIVKIGVWVGRGKRYTGTKNPEWENTHWPKPK